MTKPCERHGETYCTACAINAIKRPTTGGPSYGKDRLGREIRPFGVFECPKCYRTIPGAYHAPGCDFRFC